MKNENIGQAVASIDKIRLVARIKGDNAERMLNYLSALSAHSLIDTNYKLIDGKAYGTIFGGFDKFTGQKHGAIFFRIVLAKEKATGEVLPIGEDDIVDVRDLMDEDGRPGWAYMLACYAEAMKRKEMASTLHQFLRLEMEYNPNHFEKTPLMAETVQELLGFVAINTIKLTRFDIAMDFYQDIINGYQWDDQVTNRECASYTKSRQATGWLVGKNGNNVQISIYDKNKEREDNKQAQDIKHKHWNRVEVRLSRSASVKKNLDNWDEFNPFDKCGLIIATQDELEKMVRLIPKPDNLKNASQMTAYQNKVLAVNMLQTDIEMFNAMFASSKTRSNHRKLYNDLRNELYGESKIDLYGAFESIKKEVMEQLHELLPQLLQ